MNLFYAFTFMHFYLYHLHLMLISFFSLEHLFLYYFIFAYLGLSFPFLRYLIININPKKLLMALGLFGYHPWHYGEVDFFLDLGLETLAYLGDLVILSYYFVLSS